MRGRGSKQFRQVEGRPTRKNAEVKTLIKPESRRKGSLHAGYATKTSLTGRTSRFAIAPGFFVNERSRKILLTPEGDLSPRGQSVIEHTPMKRFGEADELLGGVLWLTNDEQARFVTGITVPVDGGFLASPGV